MHTPTRDVERGSFYHHPSAKPFTCTCEHCGAEYWALGTGADGFAVDALQCPHCNRTTEVGRRE